MKKAFYPYLAEHEERQSKYEKEKLILHKFW
jgi:hypothetical protein